MVGLGGMGSAAAAALAERGARVTGFEQFSPAHDRGSSHGDSRIVRQAYFEDPAYVPLVRRAYEGWERLSADAGEPMVTWSGALMIGRPDADVVAGTLASVRSWDLPHEVLDQRAMAQRFPPFRLEPDEVAVFEPRAGFVRPEVAVRAQLARARRAGAELHFGAPIEGWQLAGDGVSVHVGGVEHHGDRLVITAGPWTSKVLADCGLPLAVKRAVMYQFEPTGSIELFAADRLPSYVFEFAPADTVYGVADLGAVDESGRSAHACKVGFHHRLDDADPDTIDRAVAEGEVQAMRAVLAERIPLLAGRCVRSTVCMYTMTPDEHFVIGALPGTDGRVAVAAGFSGHGFKFTPLVGEVLADLAIDGATAAPIDLFAPTRFATR